MRIIAVITASAAFTIAAPATGCSIDPEALEETLAAIPARVAERGYFIEGRVISAIDLKRRRPEVIQADNIFIGKGRPRTFTLHREKDFYKQRLAAARNPCGPDYITTIDITSRWFILYPAPTDRNRRGPERWVIEPWASGMFAGTKLDQLLAAADRAGRLRQNPLPIGSDEGRR